VILKHTKLFRHCKQRAFLFWNLLCTQILLNCLFLEIRKAGIHGPLCESNTVRYWTKPLTLNKNVSRKVNLKEHAWSEFIVCEHENKHM
jgi:hypothetical protein